MGYSISLHCFRLMRDWKLESFANGKEISAVPFRTDKRGVPLKVLHNFRMEFPKNYLTIWLQTEISGFSGQMVSTLGVISNQGGKRPGGETGSPPLGRSPWPCLGPMCDAEKNWHEHSFRASGAINGCQKSPLDKPEMAFSFFIFKLPVTSF